MKKNDVVRMRNDFVQDFRTGLNYNQQKILAVLLARYVVNGKELSIMNDTELLTMRELQEMLGISKSGENYKLIKKTLFDMMPKSYLIDITETYVRQTMIFDQIEINKDTELITINWSKSIKPYLTDLVNNANTTTPFVAFLSSTYLRLKSKKAQNLYLFLKSFQKQALVTKSVNELRHITECTSKTYDTYTNFNKLVLKKLIIEINELTDLNITYKAIRKGKITNSVRFTINTIAKTYKEQAYLDLKDNLVVCGVHNNVRLKQSEYEYICSKFEKYINKLSEWKYKKGINKADFDDYNEILKWANQDRVKTNHQEQQPQTAKMPEYKKNNFKVEDLSPESQELYEQVIKEQKELDLNENE